MKQVWVKRRGPIFFFAFSLIWDCETDLLALVGGLRAAVLFDYVAMDGQELAYYVEILEKVRQKKEERERVP